MAVVQISKIQIRRGQKLTGNGVPQLSSAEFAWAVDTQELFIGNGSIAEGAPYVGNTKILTENDNILSLANSYRFGSDIPNISYSVSRTLQSKIDEIQVSVVDYGAIPDGSSDCTEAFERALEDLVLKTDDKFKKVIFIPNGVYLFSSDLKIPSRTILRGENRYETVLDIGSNNIIFVSENLTEPGNFSTSDKPVKIQIENLTVDHSQGQTIITSSEDCTFDSVTWRSNYVLGETVFEPENAYAIYNIPILSAGGNVTVSGSGVSSAITRVFADTFVITLANLVQDLNNDTSVFANLYEAIVEGNTLKIRSKSSSASAASIEADFIIDALPSSEVGTIVETVIPTLEEYADGVELVNASIYWDDDLYGRRTHNNKFLNCRFENTRLAIESNQTGVIENFDTNILFDHCEFYRCDTGIYIGSVPNQANRWDLIDCKFTRIARSAIISTNGIGTHFNRCRFESVGTGIDDSQSPKTAIVSFNQSIDNILIDCYSDRQRLYTITGSETIRGYPEYINASVTLNDRNYSPIRLSDGAFPLAVFHSSQKCIILDYVLTLDVHTRLGQLTLTIDRYNNDVSLTDNFSYSSGGLTMTQFQFSAVLVNNSVEDDSTVSTNSETVLLKYNNPSATGSAGSISFSLSYSV